jgi:dTDP-4-amino-4,6-dideoxygalactose transaminase
LRLQAVPSDLVYNYAYFPIFIGDDFPVTRDALYHLLRKENIFARRYFYPLVSNFPMYRGMPSSAASNLPVGNDAADRVLCLPLYSDLGQADQDRVISGVYAAAGLAPRRQAIR